MSKKTTPQPKKSSAASTAQVTKADLVPTLTLAPVSEDQPIGACAVIMNSAGQILLGQRKNSYKSGWYGVPGGRIELGEPLDLAIAREVLEETGLELACSYAGVVRENQGSYDFIHFIFMVEGVTKKPKLMEPEKCESWQWFSQEDLPENILPGHQAAIKIVLENIPLVDLPKL